MRSTDTLKQRWTDDYLDLLNFAQRIGDIEWQRDILRTLKESDSRLAQEALERQAEALWRQFDAVNRKMLELYRQMRRTDNTYVASKLNEEVWNLKLKRIELGRQLRATLQYVL